MNVPSPDEFSEELLAAYADGELDSVGRVLVEQWLADHPDLMDALRDQRELSAANTALWDAVEPPKPNSAEWAAVRRGIEAELFPSAAIGGNRSRIYRVAGWLLAGLAFSGVAAGILWMASAPTDHQPKNVSDQPMELVRKPAAEPEVGPAPRTIADSPDKSDPLAAVAVLPMSNDDDVVLDRVPEFRGGWLPIGRHPVPGTLTLATVDDVHLEEVSPSPAWPTNGGPKMTTAPGDAPIIFAAKPR